MTNFDDARYIETLSQMIQIKTVATSDDEPTSNTEVFHEYVKNRFSELFKVAQIIEGFNGGLMIRWKGEDSSLHPLVLMSHFDVVEAEGKWDFEPFGGEVYDNIIHGRGAADTKGSLCAFLEAANLLASEGFKPKTDIYLLSSSREEIAGNDAVLFAKYFKDNGIVPSLLIDEGGAVMEKPLPIIDKPFAMIAMSERASAKLEIQGTKENVDKFKKKSKKYQFAKSMFPEEVVEMFKRMIPQMNPPFNILLKPFNLIKGLIAGVIPKVSKEGAAMVAPSISFSEENDKSYIKIACTYYHDIDSCVQKAHELGAKCGVTIVDTNVRHCPKPTDFNAPQVKLVEQVVLKTFPNTTPTPFIIFGGTDARHFVDISDCVVRFAPLIMTNKIVSTVHHPNEHIFTKSVTFAVRYYYNLINDFQTFKN